MAFDHLDMLSVLMHHGIKGQKWGKRNGPPYPLKPEVKAAAYSEKRKAYGFFADRKKKKAEEKRLQEEQKAKAAASWNGVPYKTSNPANGKYLNHDGEELDPETGLYLKDKSLSIEEDMAKVNPSWKKEGEQQGNCVLCTTAMEMRMRGYDVAAGDADGINMVISESWFEGSEHKVMGSFQDDYDFEHDTGLKSPDTDDETAWDQYSSERGKYYHKKAEEYVLKETGKNSRGELIIENDFTGWGHSIYYITKNGKITAYETQDNRVYSSKELDKLFESADNFGVRRLDDKPANVEKMKSDGAIVY